MLWFHISESKAFIEIRKKIFDSTHFNYSLNPMTFINLALIGHGYCNWNTDLFAFVKAGLTLLLPKAKRHYDLPVN